MTNDASFSTQYAGLRLFGEELKEAFVMLLAAIPEVARITHVRYWNRHTFYIVLDPPGDEARRRVDAAIQEFLSGPGSSRLSGVEWRYLSPRDPVPSSATIYRRHEATPISGLD